jgi:hypothetical protein
MQDRGIRNPIKDEYNVESSVQVQSPLYGDSILDDWAMGYGREGSSMPGSKQKEDVVAGSYLFSQRLGRCSCCSCTSSDRARTMNFECERSLFKAGDGICRKARVTPKRDTKKTKRANHRYCSTARPRLRSPRLHRSLNALWQHNCHSARCRDRL